MLDIGFSELLLIAIVGIVVIGPKDLPVVVRHVAKFLHEMRGLYSGLKGQVTQLMNEAGLNDLAHDVTTIIDLEGKPQKAYDVGGLEGLKPVASRQPVRHSLGDGGSPVASEGEVVPPPGGGRLGGGLPRSAVSIETQEHVSPSPNPLPQGEGL